MTTVILGRKGKPESTMYFRFKNDMVAYGFYADAKDSYTEDDLFCEMEDETEEEDYKQYAEPVNGWDYDECLARRE